MVASAEVHVRASVVIFTNQPHCSSTQLFKAMGMPKSIIYSEWWVKRTKVAVFLFTRPQQGAKA